MPIVGVVFKHLNRTWQNWGFTAVLRHTVVCLQTNQAYLLYCTYTPKPISERSGTRHSYPTRTTLSPTASPAALERATASSWGRVVLSIIAPRIWERPAGHRIGSFFMAQAACTRQSLFSWLAAKELAGRTLLCKKVGKEFQRGEKHACILCRAGKRKKEGDSSAQGALRCSHLKMMVRMITLKGYYFFLKMSNG